MERTLAMAPAAMSRSQCRTVPPSTMRPSRRLPVESGMSGSPEIASHRTAGAISQCLPRDGASGRGAKVAAATTPSVPRHHLADPLCAQIGGKTLPANCDGFVSDIPAQPPRYASPVIWDYPHAGAMGSVDVIRLVLSVLLLTGMSARADETPKPHGQDDRPDHWAIEKPHDSAGPRGADNQPGAAMVRDRGAQTTSPASDPKSQPETGAAMQSPQAAQ